MSHRRPPRASRPATTAVKSPGNFLVVVPRWFVFEAMLVSVAVGALLVEMRLVTRLSRSARGK